MDGGGNGRGAVEGGRGVGGGLVTEDGQVGGTRCRWRVGDVASGGGGGQGVGDGG